MKKMASKQDKFNHPEDFRVRYRFYTAEEGGRKTLPIGAGNYRSDFWYLHPDNTEDRIYMIHPEFEDPLGYLLGDVEVAIQGTARMWILIEGYRPYHRKRIKVGTKGFFMEGGRRVAECEVIALVGLETNPVSDEFFDQEGNIRS